MVSPKRFSLITLFAVAACLLVAAPAETAPAKEAGKARSFRTFLPKPGEVVQEPAGQVIQLLLDRQDKHDSESYLVQILFRGKPAVEHTHRVYGDRVEIDFLDTGKPSMRLARIRGGRVEASALDELYYHDNGARAGKASPSPTPSIRRMVRLTLYVRGKPELHFRNTLDRAFIHFQLARPSKTEESPAGKPAKVSPGSAPNR